MLQAKISESTIVLRAALIKRREKQQAAIAALAVPPGCNRTVDMQYAFVVGHNHIDTNSIATFSQKLQVGSSMHSALPAGVRCTSALLKHKHTSQPGTEM